MTGLVEDSSLASFGCSAVLVSFFMSPWSTGLQGFDLFSSFGEREGGYPCLPTLQLVSNPLGRAGTARRGARDGARTGS